MRADKIAAMRGLNEGLESCEENEFPLPGVQDARAREVFLKQLVDSIRRVEFVYVVSRRDVHPDRAVGLSKMFDPIRASVLHLRNGNFDEACWLAFLFVHFGRHPISGYRYTREVYSALGQRDSWTFEEVSKDPLALRRWLDENADTLSRGTKRGFGNHRKYISLSGSSTNGTGAAFESYVQWIERYGDHAQLFQAANKESDGTPEGAFEWLYDEMQSVRSYGRIGRFDYLTMLQKLGLADIRPGRPYLDHSTHGPNRGARKMFVSKEQLTLGELERRTQILGSYIKVGMQEMEDSLCNWGKDPISYKYFKG